MQQTWKGRQTLATSVLEHELIWSNRWASSLLRKFLLVSDGVVDQPTTLHHFEAVCDVIRGVVDAVVVAYSAEVTTLGMLAEFVVNLSDRAVEVCPADNAVRIAAALEKRCRSEFRAATLWRCAAVT